MGVHDWDRTVAPVPRTREADAGDRSGDDAALGIPFPLAGVTWAD